MRQLTNLIEKTVAGLTLLDAEALDRLQLEIEALTRAGIPAGADLAAVLPAHRLLGELLQKTEANLKLFRVTSPCRSRSADTSLYRAFSE